MMLRRSARIKALSNFQNYANISSSSSSSTSISSTSLPAICYSEDSVKRRFGRRHRSASITDPGKLILKAPPSSSSSSSNTSSSSSSITICMDITDPTGLSEPAKPLKHRERAEHIGHILTYLIFGTECITVHFMAMMMRLIKVMRGTSLGLLMVLFGFWFVLSYSMIPFNFQGLVADERSTQLLQSCQSDLETEKKYEELAFLIYQIQPLQRHLAELKTEIVTIKNNVKDLVLQTIHNEMQKVENAELISEEKLIEMLSKVLKKIDEDHVQVADYALKSSGGKIVLARTSKSFTRESSSFLWRFFNFGKHKSNPDSILQPDVYPGNCWSFPGSQGETVIELVKIIQPKAVTLQHIPKAISPTGDISSALRDFTIYGLKGQNDFEGTLLGSFTYDVNGDHIQTFHLKGENSFRYIQLKVLSNWGHKEYTSLYRVRVHKELPNSQIF